MLHDVQTFINKITFFSLNFDEMKLKLHSALCFFLFSYFLRFTIFSTCTNKRRVLLSEPTKARQSNSICFASKLSALNNFRVHLLGKPVDRKTSCDFWKITTASEFYSSFLFVILKLGENFLVGGCVSGMWELFLRVIKRSNVLLYKTIILSDDRQKFGEVRRTWELSSNDLEKIEFWLERILT